MMNRSKKPFLDYFTVIVIILTFSSLSFAAQAKNIILMIGDGIGPSHVGIAWLYATRQLGQPLVMAEVMNQGQTARLGWFDRFCFKALPENWMGNRFSLGNPSSSVGNWARV